MPTSSMMDLKNPGNCSMIMQEGNMADIRIECKGADVLMLDAIEDCGLTISFLYGIMNV